MMLDAHYYAIAGVNVSKLWRGPRTRWCTESERGQLPVLCPQTDDGTPTPGVAGHIIYRWMVDIDAVRQVPSGEKFIKGLYDDPPPSGTSQLSVVEVLDQTGFEKTKKVFTAMWSQYRQTQKVASEAAIKAQLEQWKEEDDDVLARDV